MPRRKCCGKAESQCFCRFEDSDSVAVQGGGDQPFSLEVAPALETLDTDSLSWNLDGSTLSAEASAPVDVQIFEEDGTYTRPPNATIARIVLVGGGNGGYGAEGEFGGFGGVAGGLLIAHLAGGSIPASAPVTVGGGGSPGGPGTSFLGGVSNFNTVFFTSDDPLGIGIRCPGAGADFRSDAKRVFQEGSTSWETVLPRVTLGWPYYVPGGGGRGYGIPITGSQIESATAGMWALASKGQRPFPSSESDSLGLSGNPGQPGVDNLVTLVGSGGGGGGPGQNGGDGGKYGGGGGGGGAPGPGNPDTFGGRGADGVCVVITW